ncbi:MAG: Sapep family Mn(2+)-dependent dipeptidase [Candidatus Enteromonas sp.]|nr:Sapep family Mn(2+)-dependent dipeptidase [Candidatus Enteromonas sp.]
MANFKKLAKQYEENAILALQEFVAKNSVYDEKSITPDAPYGKGVKSALDYIAKLGNDFGFKVDKCDGHATELTYGEGNGPLIGIYAHSDVVPATGKWTYPPFSAKIVGEGKEAKMYGRGTSDDKGPLIAALYACKLLKDNGLVDNYRIRLVAGGDEERGSSCLRYYFHDLKKPASDYGFTPDADFPLIYAEKGMVGDTFAKRKIDLSPIIAMDGGVVRNAVCDKLVVTIAADKKLKDAWKAELGDLSDCGKIFILTFKGKSAHGSTPELGENAALKAFTFLGGLYKNKFLTNLAKIFEDCHGKGFGGYSNSKELGESTYNIGIVKYMNGEFSFSIDYRYGEEAKPEEAIANLKKAAEMDVDVAAYVPYLLYDKKSPLVSTLMKSYKRMTLKLFDKPLAIGGGTYAKEAPNCVAYGSAFKNHPGDIHSPNEYIYINDFTAQIAIYADAIYSLGQIKK